SQNSSIFVNSRAWTSEFSVAPDSPQYGAEAGAGLSRTVNLTRRMTWDSRAVASYSPFFNFAPVGLTPGLDAGQLPSTVTPGLGVAGVGAANVSVTGSTGVSQALSRHSTLAANLLFQQVHF